MTSDGQRLGGPWYCPGVAKRRKHRVEEVSLESRHERRGFLEHTSTGTATTSLLDVHSTSHEFSSVEVGNSVLSIFSVLHGDESETTRIFRVRITHNGAFLDLYQSRSKYEWKWSTKGGKGDVKRTRPNLAKTSSRSRSSTRVERPET